MSNRKRAGRKAKTASATPEALQLLQRFPLLDALFGRRSRRFGAGMEIPDGPFKYRSERAAEPIGEFERTLLIAIGAGISGWNFGFPHAANGPGETGCDYPVRSVGRTYPSGAAVYGSELLVTDDSGTYITKFRDLDAGAIQSVRSPEELVEQLGKHIVRLGDKRVQLPAEFPHIGTHNQWAANKPGSTLFVPVADQVETLLNLLWIYAGEGSPVLDERGAKLGRPAGLLKKGTLRAERAVPLATIEAVALKHSTAELSIAAYNVQLGLQAIGLGGWLYTGINGPSLLGAYAEQDIPGFGFRFSGKGSPDKLIPLGLDGAFEPLIPPYVPSMTEAARRFLDRKFGRDGVFGPTRPTPYAHEAEVKRALSSPDPDKVAYFIDLVAEIYDRYGRFPTEVAPVGVSIYTQAQHIDTAFYDRFYKPGAYLETHRTHDALWHGGE